MYRFIYNITLTVWSWSPDSLACMNTDWNWTYEVYTKRWCISPAALSASRSGGREMLAREALGRVSCIISCWLGNEYSVSSSTAMLWALRAREKSQLTLTQSCIHSCIQCTYNMFEASTHDVIYVCVHLYEHDGTISMHTYPCCPQWCSRFDLALPPHR